MTEHEIWMRKALELAQEAAAAGEVPVGAIVVKEGQIIACARNEKEALHDATAHAEILALRRSGQALGHWQLSGCTLYVTLEPCPMCAGAIMQSRLSRVVFGAYDGRAGCCGTLYNLPGDDRFPVHVDVEGGVLREECAALLTEFFRSRREEERIY